LSYNARVLNCDFELVPVARFELACRAGTLTSTLTGSSYPDNKGAVGAAAFSSDWLWGVSLPKLLVVLVCCRAGHCHEVNVVLSASSLENSRGLGHLIREQNSKLRDDMC
jgi:hypothetical protein